MNFNNIELRFNIITNVLLLFFCYSERSLMVSVITMCNLIKCLIHATCLSTPASDVHERHGQAIKKLRERLLTINKRNTRNTYLAITLAKIDLETALKLSPVGRG